MHSEIIIYSAIFIILLSIFILFNIWILKKSNPQKDKLYVSKYNRRRITDVKTLNKEAAIMKDLREGRIKCHTIPNSALPYDVEQWVLEMVDFIKKPIQKQLLFLEGYDIDGQN